MKIDQWVEIVKGLTAHLGQPIEGVIEGESQDGGHRGEEGDVCCGTRHSWRWVCGSDIMLFVIAASHEECSPDLLDVRIRRHVCWIQISLLQVGRFGLEIEVDGLQASTWWMNCTGHDLQPVADSPRLEFDATALLPSWSAEEEKPRRRLTDLEASQLLTAMVGWFTAHRLQSGESTP